MTGQAMGPGARPIALDLGAVVAGNMDHQAVTYDDAHMRIQPPTAEDRDVKGDRLADNRHPQWRHDGAGDDSGKLAMFLDG